MVEREGCHGRNTTNSWELWYPTLPEVGRECLKTTFRKNESISEWLRQTCNCEVG